MNTNPLSDTALLQLMTWLSPSFPVGGYVYSHGIEFAVEDERVTDETSLVNWIDGIVTYGAGKVDGVLFVKAWQAVTDKDDRAFYEIVERADAMRSTAEQALEGTAQGEAFIDTVRQTSRMDALDRLIDILVRFDRPLTYAVAVAAVAAAAEIPQRPSLLAYTNGFVANMVSAGVRLVPLGQIAGQRAIESLKPVVQRSVDAAMSRSLEDIGTAAPLVDWTSMSHETQYTRLFRS